jgi:outer membrane protein
MKKFLLVIFAATLFIFGTAAFAELKIAVVDMNKVMMESPQFKAAERDFKSKFNSREKTIVDAQKSFQKDIEDFNKNGPTMKVEDQKATQKKIIDQQKKLQQMQADFQKDVNVAQNKAMKDIVSKIEAVIKKVATDKKVDIIFEKIGVRYSKPEFDVTDEVIKQMKK